MYLKCDCNQIYKHTLVNLELIIFVLGVRYYLNVTENQLTDYNRLTPMEL